MITWSYYYMLYVKSRVEKENAVFEEVGSMSVRIVCTSYAST